MRSFRLIHFLGLRISVGKASCRTLMSNLQQQSATRAFLKLNVRVFHAPQETSVTDVDAFLTPQQNSSIRDWGAAASNENHDSHQHQTLPMTREAQLAAWKSERAAPLTKRSGACAAAAAAPASCQSSYGTPSSRASASQALLSVGSRRFSGSNVSSSTLSNRRRSNNSTKEQRPVSIASSGKPPTASTHRSNNSDSNLAARDRRTPCSLTHTGSNLLRNRLSSGSTTGRPPVAKSPRYHACPPSFSGPGEEDAAAASELLPTPNFPLAAQLQRKSRSAGVGQRPSGGCIVLRRAHPSNQACALVQSRERRASLPMERLSVQAAARRAHERASMPPQTPSQVVPEVTFANGSGAMVASPMTCSVASGSSRPDDRALHDIRSRHDTVDENAPFVYDDANCAVGRPSSLMETVQLSPWNDDQSLSSATATVRWRQTNAEDDPSLAASAAFFDNLLVAFVPRDAQLAPVTELHPTLALHDGGTKFVDTVARRGIDGETARPDCVTFNDIVSLEPATHVPSCSAGAYQDDDMTVKPPLPSECARLAASPCAERTSCASVNSTRVPSLLTQDNQRIMAALSLTESTDEELEDIAHAAALCLSRVDDSWPFIPDLSRTVPTPNHDVVGEPPTVSEPVKLATYNANAMPTLQRESVPCGDVLIVAEALASADVSPLPPFLPNATACCAEISCEQQRGANATVQEQRSKYRVSNEPDGAAFPTQREVANEADHQAVALVDSCETKVGELLCAAIAPLSPKKFTKDLKDAPFDDNCTSKALDTGSFEEDVLNAYRQIRASEPFDDIITKPSIDDDCPQLQSALREFEAFDWRREILSPAELPVRRRKDATELCLPAPILTKSRDSLGGDWSVQLTIPPMTTPVGAVSINEDDSFDWRKEIQSPAIPFRSKRRTSGATTTLMGEGENRIGARLQCASTGSSSRGTDEQACSDSDGDFPSPMRSKGFSTEKTSALNERGRLVRSETETRLLGEKEENAGHCSTVARADEPLAMQGKLRIRSRKVVSPRGTDKPSFSLAERSDDSSSESTIAAAIEQTLDLIRVEGKKTLLPTVQEDCVAMHLVDLKEHHRLMVENKKLRDTVQTMRKSDDDRATPFRDAFDTVSSDFMWASMYGSPFDSLFLTPVNADAQTPYDERTIGTGQDRR